MIKSKCYFPTLKEVNNVITCQSHHLMVKAGLIRQLSAGLYSWLPLGLLVLKKLENIIRIEMNKTGAQECLLPVLQQKKLLEKTNRWDEFGNLLFKFKDRKKNTFCLSPTHEEVISHTILKDIASRKTFPILLYQIQTKFRDEIRPRSGIIRTREFIMKDAYSFDATEEEMVKTYNRIHRVYENIFESLNINYKVIWADSGNIGGQINQEFHAISDAGEDHIVYSDSSNYAANIECASFLHESKIKHENFQEKKTIDFDKKKSSKEIINFIEEKYKKVIVKAILVKGEKNTPVPFLININHDINMNKLNDLDFLGNNIVIDKNQCLIEKIYNKYEKIYIDKSIENIYNFVFFSESEKTVIINNNWGRDIIYKESYDIRNAIENDISPDGMGKLKIKKGIEIGHIFQLKDKYSKVFQNKISKTLKNDSNIMMGCYGIGVSRLLAAYIEQNHDEKGIIWSDILCPFKIVIVALNYKNSNVKRVSDNIYENLKQNNIEVLLDEEDTNPGVKLKNMDLIGIPHRIILSEKCINNGVFEYSYRMNKIKTMFPIDNAIKSIKKMLKLKEN